MYFSSPPINSNFSVWMSSSIWQIVSMLLHLLYQHYIFHLWCTLSLFISFSPQKQQVDVSGDSLVAKVSHFEFQCMRVKKKKWQNHPGLWWSGKYPSYLIRSPGFEPLVRNRFCQRTLYFKCGTFWRDFEFNWQQYGTGHRMKNQKNKIGKSLTLPIN